MAKKPIPIQVVTWNVHFRGASVLDALKAHTQPDILTLQEVTLNQHRHFEECLTKMGLQYLHYSGRPDQGKRYGNVIASRWPLEVIELRYSEKKLPWSQLLAQASVEVNGRSIVVITAHIPNGANNGWKKIDTFQVLNKLVRQAKGKPCVVTGDFNEPQFVPLQDNGNIVTWGQEWNERKGCYELWPKEWEFDGRTGKGKKWDAAVRWLFEEQAEHGLQYAYWEIHGRGVMPVSHVNRGQPRWFDHMFVSRNFHVERCEYLHELRKPGSGLSDHSALSARLVLATQH